MLLHLRSLLLSVFCVGTVYAQAQQGYLEGKVLDNISKKPIDQAFIEVLDQPSKLMAYSKPDGSFSISEISTKTYTVRVSMQGYAVWEQPLMAANDTLTILVQLNIAASNITTQTARGLVTDNTSGAPIGQALVELLNFSPYKSTYSNDMGEFVLEGVPVGRQRFRITKNGYEEYIARDEIVSAGRELLLEVALDEFVEVVGKANTNGGDPNSSISARQMRIVNTRMLPSNQLALGGAHPFTIEEVQRFSGCLNDPARTVAASLAGTFNTDDTQNFIIARGNTPYGNAWYIDGIPFENPNHFGTMGNTGAPFQILNTNTLGNSDFLISAAPAEYGGAFSSIFDLRIREGNSQRFQFQGQFSLLGGEVLAEGPFKKGRASFVVAYRYSLLHLIQLLGIDITSGSAPQYQDLTFKTHFETKNAGSFSFFGTGGIGKVDLLDEDLDPNDLFAERGRDLYVRTKMALLGLKHQKFINRNTYLQTTLFAVHQNYQSHRDSILQRATDTFPKVVMSLYDVRNIRTNTGINFLVNSKINAQYSFRTGFRSQVHFMNIYDRYLHYEYFGRQFTEFWSDDILFENEVYFENQIRVSDKFVLVAGLHGHHFSINKRSFAIEPRVAMNWYLGRRNTLSLAYGWHSKNPTFTMLFFVRENGDGTWDDSNRNLGFIRSHHLNLSHNFQISHEWRILTEVYGQYLTNIPIETAPSSFSLINYGEHPIYPKLIHLESEGIAYNYGAELTVQKFFSNGYYGTLCGSYFRSRYQGSDGIWRNTAFDAQYMVQLAAGKEFKIGRRRNNVITLDLRFHHHGGRPYTPIDVLASEAAGREVLDHENAYSERVRPYSRLDFKFGARFNQRKKRISHYFYLDVINVPMFNNELKKQYNVAYDPLFPPTGNNIPVLTSAQFGLLPNIFYQISF